MCSRASSGVIRQNRLLIQEDMTDFDLPPDLFCAESDEATAENYLKHREAAVVGELVHAFQALPSTPASQHLQGCSRRLIMMRYARLEILATAKEATRP